MQFSEMIEDIPKSPGVYQMFDADGALLYVGKAKNLYNRLHQYINTERLSYHIKLMRSHVARVEFITTATETDALLLESDFIKNKRPRYNILLTDDKMYPMLMLSPDKFPRLVKFRGRAIPKRDVFGPYPSVGSLNETIKLVQKVCKIRTCGNSYMNNRTRPCLLHQIGRCSAPCMSNVGANDYLPLQYSEAVSMARRILSGDIAPVVGELSREMQSASEKQDYEGAAKIRDQIRALSGTSSRGKMSGRDADFFAGDFGESPVIAIARMRGGRWISHQIIRPRQTDGLSPADIIEQTVLWFCSEESRGPRAESRTKIVTNIKSGLLQSVFGSRFSARESDPEIKNLLAQVAANARVFGAREINWNESVGELEKWLGIKIDRADVFDNSHIFGKNPVGSMIVFTRDGFAKKEYRHYKLQDLSRAGNDIGMMEEFLQRRYSNVGANPGPAKIADFCGWNNYLPLQSSLVIVDGGRAQWNIAKKVLGKLNLDIPVLGVTKGEVRDGDEHFIRPDGATDTSVPKDSKLFLLLRSVRDESHRFAIAFHRKTRGAAATASALDEIEGIGGARKKALLHHFGSVRQITDADADAISRVAGISKSAAQKIYLHFHPENV
ncbi:MAG: excinuclease ABC subunit UvrC [Proteobacteria bacterium]|nr:excinuclease ABC subunit UvrC [Pseudomonadota bacterium]